MLQLYLQKIKKRINNEVKVLLSKGFEFIEKIKLKRKNTQATKQKMLLRVTASVNCVNTTETILT